MTKKRKLSGSTPIKVEVKEENVMGNDYLMAKGRLKGVLRQLTENTDSDSDYSDDNRGYRSRKYVIFVFVCLFGFWLQFAVVVFCLVFTVCCNHMFTVFCNRFWILITVCCSPFLSFVYSLL